MDDNVSRNTVQARQFHLQGLVQGIGFRPFVWHLARELGLHGWVCNDAGGVAIHVEGQAAALADFATRLPQEAPALSRIDLCRQTSARPAGHAGFAILASQGGAVQTAIGPDLAVCPDCLAELFDPAGRRWRYPFLACTRCGPRYTVSRHLPYARSSTSLAPFPLCPTCQHEYDDPADRRFHAEATACPDCGPRHWLLDAAGQPVAGDPLTEAWRRLQAGQIIALKGLGGFHLVCDARQSGAVAELRRRKHRDAKPLAVMAASPSVLADWVRLDALAIRTLESPARPIVLLPARPGTARHLPGIAPGLPWLGVMLPATPLQWLLFHEAAGRPAGTGWLQTPPETLLVMTSANPGGEPLVIDNAEALSRLAGLADAFLLHDREIVVRCDDSILRCQDGRLHMIRRARGHVPLPLRLPECPVPDPSCPSGQAEPANVLAFGGYLKNTVCVLKGNQAFVSQHIGSLDNPATLSFLAETARHLLDVLQVSPTLMAHDAHPDYPSSQLAEAWAAEAARPLPDQAVRAVPILHHVAHAVAVMAEHQQQIGTGPVLALALDGIGLGENGQLWGGELLRLQGADWQHLGGLRPLPLPGGDRAAREPWRMAVASLALAGREAEIPAFLAETCPEITEKYGPQAALPLLTLMQKGLNSPLTSSLGRWFDAAAGILGVRAVMQYEAQAAMELEGLAASVTEDTASLWPDAYRIAHIPDTPDRPPRLTLDLLPLLARLHDVWQQEKRDAAQQARLARIFHHTLARALAEWVIAAARQTGIRQVVAAGGCCLNRLLMDRLGQHLATAELTLLEAQDFPPNDGGLALGQAWLARQQQARLRINAASEPPR